MLKKKPTGLPPGLYFTTITIMRTIMLTVCVLSSYLVIGDTQPIPFRNNYYKKLLDRYFITLKEEETANDLNAKAEDLNNIANIYYTLKNYDMAAGYYRMSQATNQELKLTDVVYQQYFSLSKVYRDQKKYDSSMVCLSRSIKYFKEMKNDTTDLFDAYYNMAALFNDQRKTQIAVCYYDSAIVLAKELSHVFLLKCLAGKSDLYMDSHDYSRSIEIANEGLAISQQTGASDFTLEFLHLLYLNNKNLHKPDDAYKYLEAYYYLNDSLQSNKATKAFADMSNSFVAAAKEKENEILKQQNQNYLLVQKFYITGLVMGLLLIASLFFIARSQFKKIRFKNDVIAHEKKIKTQLISSIDQEKSHKNQLITEHQEIIETVTMEKSQITEELERKNNDLLTATTYMIKTNEKLMEISANFRNIASKLQKSSSLNEEIYQTIEAIEKLTTKDTWDTFRNKFIDVHPNFFKNLNDKCAGLTQNEMKLAAMISMNLSSKDIAKITMQQHNSINVARYRLRKKLNMETEDQLIGFLLQL